MDALERMFHVLVRTLREKNPALLTAPFTVGELHSQILPYRHFRRELGLETNQQYELVLLEMLTGARGLLDVDERLRDELGKELASGHPEPSRVREFADAHVSVNAAAQARVPDVRPSPARSSTPQAAPLAMPRASTPNSLGTVGAAQDSSRCRYCGKDLPDGGERPVNYCPHCGQNLQVLNCPACGGEVEAGWRFCVSCGKAVS
jgi:hypothetical protein